MHPTAATTRRPPRSPHTPQRSPLQDLLHHIPRQPATRHININRHHTRPHLHRPRHTPPSLNQPPSSHHIRHNLHTPVHTIQHHHRPRKQHTLKPRHNTTKAR